MIDNIPSNNIAAFNNLPSYYANKSFGKGIFNNCSKIIKVIPIINKDTITDLIRLFFSINIKINKIKTPKLTNIPKYSNINKARTKNKTKIENFKRLVDSILF